MEEKTSKNNVVENAIALFAAAIALLTFLFGDNILQRIKTTDDTSSTSISTNIETTEISNRVGPITDMNVVLANTDEIQSDIEKSFSSLGFEKGSITTETATFDTSTMSAEIHDLYIGNTAYLWKDLNSGKYTALFIPIHFSMNINQTLTFDKQTIDDVVGYAWITLFEVDKQGNLCYEVYNYLTAQYFMSEELLYEHLCGNGYIVEKIELNR